MSHRGQALSLVAGAALAAACVLLVLRSMPTLVTAGEGTGEKTANAAESTNYREVADSLLVVAINFLREGQLDQALETMAPGYEAAKRLNDFELLHQYSATYAEIYSRMHEEGLASYYASLGKWFSDRLEQAEEADPVSTGTERGTAATAVNRTVPQEDPPFLTGMQAGTIGILVILIILLIMENVRLRKRMRDL